MPAKKKKGSKKKKTKEKKAPPPPDEFDLMDEEQLHDEANKAAMKLNEIRRNRNYYLIERDQVQQFYDIVREEATKTESHIRNIESQMEKMQEAHRNDIRIYLQKVIHLEYEHANNVDAVQTQAQKMRVGEEAEHLKRKAELKKLKMELKATLSTKEVENEREIKMHHENAAKELLKLREEFTKNHQSLVEKADARLQELKDDLELRRKLEIHELQERKHRHMNDLMDNFERAFAEMRTYYNSITQENLALIKTLHEEIEDLKLKHAQNEKTMEEIARKNAQLSEPLRKVEKEVDECQQKLINYDKDKISLKHSLAQLAKFEEEFKRLSEAQTSLRDMYNTAVSERDRLYNTFESKVLEVQGRGRQRNETLERMLEEYKDVFEVKKAQFTSVLRASNLDPVVLANVTKKLDDVLSSKNEQISELTYEVAKIQKAHDDLVRVYQAKLSALGVATGDIKVDSLFGSTNTAPADLICS